MCLIGQFVYLREGRENEQEQADRIFYLIFVSLRSNNYYKENIHLFGAVIKSVLIKFKILKAYKLGRKNLQ